MEEGELADMDQVILAKHCKSQASILPAEGASTVERHAAEELQRIVKEMTGALLPMIAAPEQAGAAEALILIGRPETHAEIRRLVEAGLLKLSADDPGLDGYVMAAAREGGRTYLVLGGSQDRSALYAVYHFLEKYGGCGWWFDGDTIPKTDLLAITLIHDRIRPRFENRLGTGYFYDNDFWTVDDWKHYFDYLAKRRFNIVFWLYTKMPYSTLTLQRMGMAVQLTPVEKQRLEIVKQYLAYARQQLGFRVVHPSQYGSDWWRGRNGNEYYLKHKDDIRWIKQEWGSFVYHIMDPKDPACRKLHEALIRTCIEDFGTDHLYSIATTSEETTDLPLDKIPQFIADGARASLDVVRKVDPQARFLLDWWCLVASEGGGQRQAYAMGSLQVLRDEPDTIGQEIASESAASDHPFYYELYSDTNGCYYGRPWHAGIFLGGGSGLRMYGDIPRLIWQFRSLADDPRAHNLLGVFMCPESGHDHNFLWFDCAAQLVFDPGQVDLETLSKRFALRRYGPMGEPMAKAVDLLLQTVYSSFNSSLSNRPFYYVWEGRGCWTPIAEQNKLLISFSPKLAEALRIVLDQESALGDAPHYKRDLIELGIQYLGGRGTDYYWRMVQAYKDKDLEAFQRWAGRAMEMMDYQARLTGTWPNFRISAYEANAMKWPTMDPSQDFNFPRQVPTKDFDNAMFYRIFHTTLFYPDNWMLDYAARDWAELIAYVYKPELELRARAMWKELTQGQAIPQAALEQKITGYLMDLQGQSPFPDENAIYHKFIKEGYPRMAYYEGSVPKLVEEILARFPPEE